MKVIVTLLIESDNGCLIPHSSLFVGTGNGIEDRTNQESQTYWI